MTIWFVIDSSLGPPSAVDVFRTAYLATNIRSADNPNEAEGLGEPVEGLSGRFLTGSFRITTTQANDLTAGHVPWIKMFTEFPPASEWQPKTAV